MMEVLPAAMQIDSLTTRLADAARADGGWAYYRGKASRIEPTCWAVLAQEHVSLSDHLSFFRSRRQPDGLLTDPGSPLANYGWNGLALLTLQSSDAGVSSDIYPPLVAALLAAKGVQLRPELTTAIPQDGMLQAWSWTEGTFSWVEPTAYCMLALKQMASRGPDAEARIDEAEAVLLDRVCPEGGWNYGNSAVLGQDLRPYVSTTALGVLGLQGREELDAVRRSLAWLEANAVSEGSAMALSLTAIALHTFGRPTAEVLDRLTGVYETTGFLDNAHLMAMALYALTIDRHGARHFLARRS